MTAAVYNLIRITYATADIERREPALLRRLFADVTFGFRPEVQSVVQLLYGSTNMKQQRGHLAGAKGPLSWFFTLVAGAGFEPATFGL